MLWPEVFILNHESLFKLMNYALMMMNSLLAMMNDALKMMNSVFLKRMNLYQT